MTRDEAYRFLDSVLSTIPGTRQDHANIEQALAALISEPMLEAVVDQD